VQFFSGTTWQDGGQTGHGKDFPLFTRFKILPQYSLPR